MLATFQWQNIIPLENHLIKVHNAVLSENRTLSKLVEIQDWKKIRNTQQASWNTGLEKNKKHSAS